MLAAIACSWPEPHTNVTRGARPDRYTRIVVLADPQLTDRTSYRSLSSGPLLLVCFRRRIRDRARRACARAERAPSICPTLMRPHLVRLLPCAGCGGAVRRIPGAGRVADALHDAACRAVSWRSHGRGCSAFGCGVRPILAPTWACPVSPALVGRHARCRQS